MSEHVLVTGGGGFIGSHLAAAHLASGDAVHIVVRPQHQLRSDRMLGGAIVHRIDLGDHMAVAACLKQVRPTLIYHMGTDTGRSAGLPDPAQWGALTADVRNLVALLAGASQLDGLRAFVRAGSLAEYGDAQEHPDEQVRETALIPYTACLTSGAHFAAAIQPQLHFPVLTARLALTYGAGQSETFLLPWLIRRCLDGEACEVRAPDALRDMLAVEDCVAGLRALATSALPGGSIVNLCTGRLLSVRAMADMVIAATHAPATLIRYPAQSGGTNIVGGDPERAAQWLGWRATTAFEEGVRCMVDRMRAQVAA